MHGSGAFHLVFGHSASFEQILGKGQDHVVRRVVPLGQELHLGPQEPDHLLEALVTALDAVDGDALLAGDVLHDGITGPEVAAESPVGPETRKGHVRLVAVYPFREPLVHGPGVREGLGRSYEPDMELALMAYRAQRPGTVERDAHLGIDVPPPTGEGQLGFLEPLGHGLGGVQLQGGYAPARTSVTHRNIPPLKTRPNQPRRQTWPLPGRQACRDLPRRLDSQKACRLRVCRANARPLSTAWP